MGFPGIYLKNISAYIVLTFWFYIPFFLQSPPAAAASETAGLAENTLTHAAVIPAGGRITGGITEAPGRGFVFLAEDRFLYMFDKNAAFSGKARTGGKPLPFQVSSPDPVIYSCFENNTLKAINPKGRVLWSVKTAGKPACNPVFTSDGNIVTLSGDGTVESFSYRGRKRWKAVPGSDAGSGSTLRGPGGASKTLPVNGKSAAPLPLPGYSRVMRLTSRIEAGPYGKVFAGLSDGRLLFFDSTGKAAVCGSFSESAVSAVKYIDGKYFVSDSEGSFMELDENFSVRISISLESPALAIGCSPEITAIVTRKGRAYAFDRELNALFTGRGGYFGKPLVCEGSVFFLRKSGEIVCFNIKDKTSVSVPVDPATLIGLRKGGGSEEIQPVISSAGSCLAAGGLDWNLHIFRNDKHCGKHSAAGKDSSTLSGEMAPGEMIPDNRHLIYIRQLSASGGLRNRETALSLLERVLEGDITAADEKYILYILEEIAFEGTVRKSRGLAEGTQTSGRLRAIAAELLGKTRTMVAAQMLCKMLESETDPSTAAVIIRELGNAGSDLGGESTSLFGKALDRFGSYPPLKETIVEGIRDIVEYHGYLPSQEGKNLLFKMLELNGNRDLQFKIIETLKKQ